MLVIALDITEVEVDGDIDERMYFVQSYVQEVALQTDQ